MMNPLNPSKLKYLNKLKSDRYKIGIHKLYAEDPIKADKSIWGRLTDPLTRRGFLKNSGLMAMTGALGSSIPFAKNMPAGLIPAAAIYSLSIDPNNPITPTCDITASECATPLRLGQGIPYSYTR